MVNRDFEHVDTESLKRIYETANLKFHEALLKGADWKDVQDQRELLVELAVAIHKREPKYFQDPAASDRRRGKSAAP